jgi:hypothetical protein
MCEEVPGNATGIRDDETTLRIGEKITSLKGS